MTNPSEVLARPATDPSLLFRERDSIYSVDLLIAAIVHLDFFTRLSEKPLSLDEICRAHSIVERPADVMLTLFTAMGLVRSEGNRFAVTDTAREYLVKGSRWDIGPYYAALKDRPVCRDLLEVLRTGKTAIWGSFRDEKEWAHGMEDEAFATRFTDAMDCRGKYLAPAAADALDLRDATRVLDVGGGSGIYACALAARWP